MSDTNPQIIPQGDLRTIPRIIQNVMSNKSLHINKGYVIIINTLIFMAVSVTLLSGVVNPILSHYSSSKGFLESKKSFQLANSATEEVMYRLRTNKNLSSSASVTLDSGTANISVADTYSGKQISVDAAAGDYERNISMNVIQDVGVSFSYGLQAGKGGIEMAGGAYVNGNVYSNGDIIGSGGPYITGSATVANASDPVANQSNGTVFPPTYSATFGGNATPQDFSQSFQVSTTTAVTSVRFYIKKSADVWMNNITVRIVSDNSSHPNKTTLASGALGASQITTSLNYISVPFSSAISLTPGTTYWIVLDTSTTWGSFYTIGASLNTYANGLVKTGTWSSSGSGANAGGSNWTNTTPSGLDSYFDIYVGGDTGLIDDIERIGTGSTGDAWAHEVNDVDTIYGTLYCQASNNIGGGKTCNTSRPDPVEQPFPISDGNIDDWKTQATAGGTFNGNKSYSGGTSYLGPQKVVGNLSVGGGAILKLTGTLYVTGNISLQGGGKIQLDPTYGSNSGVIITDGRVSAGGGGQFAGSGTSGSYILVVTTSDCPTGATCSGNPAIDVSGGSGSVVLNAQKGTIEFSGGAAAKEATAHKLELTGGASVTYETGLANINFVGGPSGSWYISSWDEVE